MIRYLQRLKAKKGFTVVELIIVIAIIAVLTAVIFSNSGTEEKKKQAANDAARDFYNSVQYSFTKYMKYESALSIAIANDTTAVNNSDKIIHYYPKLNGNYPREKYTFIKMLVEKNQIQYVKTFNGTNGFEDLLKDKTTSSNMNGANVLNEFDKLLKSDFDTVLETNVNGYYYALVIFDGAAAADDNVKSTPVKVHSTYYSERAIDELVGDVTQYRVNNLWFNDYCRLKSGNICGVCTSAKYENSDGDRVYLGNEGTFFMGATDSSGKLEITLQS